MCFIKGPPCPAMKKQMLKVGHYVPNRSIQKKDICHYKLMDLFGLPFSLTQAIKFVNWSHI